LGDYIVKINKLYIRKTDCNKKVDESYKKGIESGKNDAYKAIAQGAGPNFLKKCLHPSDNNNKPSGKQNIGYLNDNLKNLTIGNQTFIGCNKLSKINLLISASG